MLGCLLAGEGVWGLAATTTAMMVKDRGGKRRLETNAPGPLYVDESCIDCDTCRWMSSMFERRGTKSAVVTQPTDEGSWMAAQRAAVACPTGSIRTTEARNEAKIARDEFPRRLDGLQNVYHAGYHSSKSFGATPYIVETESGGVLMIDSPRYSSSLAKAIHERFGPPSMLLLTHIDDVGDHNRWKDRFPSLKRVIHNLEVRGPDQWPYIDTRDIEVQLTSEETSLMKDVTAIHVPGHSKGSLAFLVHAGNDKVLFTGDHLAYSHRLDRIDGFARYGWDIKQQADSIKALSDLDFLHILPGHGRRVDFKSSEDRSEKILHAAKVFKDDPYGQQRY